MTSKTLQRHQKSTTPERLPRRTSAVPLVTGSVLTTTTYFCRCSRLFAIYVTATWIFNNYCLLTDSMPDYYRSAIVPLALHQRATRFVQQRCQIIVNCLSGTEYPRTHRADRAIHHISNLFVRQAIYFAQRNRRFEILR